MSIQNDSLVKDANGISVQVGSGFSTTDGISVSPITLTGGIDSIMIPSEKCELILYPITNDLAVSEDSTMASSDLVTKGNKEPFPVARMKTVYIQGTTEDTVYYRFHYV